MMRTKFFARTALGVALAIGMAAGSASPVMAKDKEKPAESKGAANSKEFATAAIPLQKTLTEVQPIITKFNTAQGPAKDAALAEMKTALAAAVPQLAAAEAAIKTPGDRLLAGRWGMMIGAVTGDTKLVQHAAQGAVDSGVVPSADSAYINFRLGSAAYANGDYPTSIKALTTVVAANYPEDSAVPLLADAQSRVGQPAQGLAVIKTAVEARKAAGQAVPSPWFERAVQIAYTSKLNTESMYWAAERLDAYPIQFNWVSAAQIVRETQNYSGADSIDVSRLLWWAGALKVNNQSVQREYIEYVQAAIGKVGVLYPGEVVKVINQGLALGTLKRTDPFVADALNEGNRRLAADKASLAGFERDARVPTATAKITQVAADTFLSYEMYPKAEELYRLAMSKPGANVATLNLRLGIAQLGQGKAADAQASFAKVEGNLKPLARLWSILAAGKGVKAN
jgi:hypothetical protein